ncbi:MAG: Fic family protein [Gemmatimonadetes bacterium]|nr:Fic family protein [Gemmatimonadota bacterium]
MKRSICKSHPWIIFELDLRRLQPRHWLMLGECSSRIQEIIGIPLAPSLEERLNRVYVSRGLRGTAAIEGNTLTQEQVELRLEGRLELPQSEEYLGREIDNLARAYGLVSAGIRKSVRAPITEERIKEFNRLILEKIPVEPEVVPGEYAHRQHGVGTYRAPPPTAIRNLLMPAYVDWIASIDQQSAGGSRFALPILHAILAHLYLAWIHPFGDGNGRTARIVEADLLARAGVPEISYHLLSSYYNQTRIEYYRVLRRTSATPAGDPFIFIDYALSGLDDGLRQQLGAIKLQHREIMWRDFIYEHFRDLNSPRFVRLRRIAMDLAKLNDPVRKEDLRAISPRVAESYAGKTMKTATRDVRDLMRRKLIRREGEGFVANVDLLLAFVPPSRVVD